MAISPFKKQKSPADTMLLRPGLLLSKLWASKSASERQSGIKNSPMHPFSELCGPRHHLLRKALALCRFFASAAWLMY
jgi:hypothetical protein